MLPFLSSITDLVKKGTGITAMEFQEAVIDAVKDGKLTKDEIDRLETMREELGLPLDVLHAIRVQAYVRAFETVSSDTNVTDDEWEEMEQIQDYLGVKDAEVARTKKELYRLRVISEIRKGNLPLLLSPHLILKPGEVSYWSEEVDGGELILTNKRIVFRGKNETVTVTIGRLVDIQCSDTGVVIHVNRQKPLSLRYLHPQNHDIVRSVLFAVVQNAGENA